jgi:hypothetical protein
MATRRRSANVRGSRSVRIHQGVLAGTGHSRVSEKVKDRARQNFDRSAEQAGFFEHGKNRLVMPAVVSGRDVWREEEKSREETTGGGSGGGKDPLIAALIQKLPDSGTDWPIDDRVMWLQMISMAFQMAYGQKDVIKITKETTTKDEQRPAKVMPPPPV